MPVYLVFSDDVPEEVSQILGKSRALLKHGTSYDVGKIMMRQSGGPDKLSQVWQIERAFAEEVPLGEIPERVRALVSSGETFELSLGDAGIPIDILFEIARRAGAVLHLKAVFQADPDKTWND